MKIASNPNRIQGPVIGKMYGYIFETNKGDLIRMADGIKQSEEFAKWGSYVISDDNIIKVDWPVHTMTNRPYDPQPNRDITKPLGIRMGYEKGDVPQTMLFATYFNSSPFDIITVSEDDLILILGGLPEKTLEANLDTTIKRPDDWEDWFIYTTDSTGSRYYGFKNPREYNRLTTKHKIKSMTTKLNLFSALRERIVKCGCPIGMKAYNEMSKYVAPGDGIIEIENDQVDTFCSGPGLIYKVAEKLYSEHDDRAIKAFGIIQAALPDEGNISKEEYEDSMRKLHTYCSNNPVKQRVFNQLVRTF
jgi:hypothetical protein